MNHTTKATQKDNTRESRFPAMHGLSKYPDRIKKRATGVDAMVAFPLKANGEWAIITKRIATMRDKSGAPSVFMTTPGSE
ncbi:MAG: hypothetical protein MR890_10150 [Akkermansia muciniphila]|nr:hypothetical protein [Akkermansia muciniphila]